MNINRLSIEGFSPNCLMGVTGAVAKYKYNEANINRLYFHHSYVYEKNDQVYYDPKIQGLNVNFSRELPISKQKFSERLQQYYGLNHFYRTYSDFEKMIRDIDEINQTDEPVMVEIDFFYMKNHRFYHKVHDQHMMIVYSVNFEKQCFHVCEAVFGYIQFDFSDYKEYFDDVKNNRNRGIFTIVLRKKGQEVKSICKKISLKNFQEDIEKTLDNLSQNNSSSTGVGAFKEFRKDFLGIIQSPISINSFFVPGMWVFMCDGMNCFNFINEFINDYPDFSKESLAEIKKCCTIINRKWYYITMAINEVNRYKLCDFEKAFESIEKAEAVFVDKLNTLKLEIAKIS